MRPMIQVKVNRIWNRPPTSYEQRRFAATLAEYPPQSMFHKMQLARARLRRLRRRGPISLVYTPEMVRIAPTVEHTPYLAGRRLTELVDHAEVHNANGLVEVIKTRAVAEPDPLLHTDFKHTERVHDWRNHIGEAVRALWTTFTPAQRAALQTDAAERASAENWE